MTGKTKKSAQDMEQEAVENAVLRRMLDTPPQPRKPKSEDDQEASSKQPRKSGRGV